MQGSAHFPDALRALISLLAPMFRPFNGPFGAGEAAAARSSGFFNAVERTVPEAPPTPPPHALQVGG